jgi:hypothetical protein
LSGSFANPNGNGGCSKPRPINFFLAHDQMNIYRGLAEKQGLAVTIIEIRPFRNGWKCFEASGVEPVFLHQEQAIGYATGRACFRSG